MRFSTLFVFSKTNRVLEERRLNSILDTLRAIKQEGDSFCLQSFVGLGPFSILELTGQSTSPFNVQDAMQIQYRTKEQVQDLFAQHSSTIDSKIIDDVYQRTAGHPEEGKFIPI